MKKLNQSVKVTLIGMTLTLMLGTWNQAFAKDEFVVYPSNADSSAQKAEEDWQNITAAISSYPVVRLAHGEFYLPRSIVLWNPDLELKGSGPNKTTVKTAPGIAFEVAQLGTGDWTSRHLFAFPYDDTIGGGYIGQLSISDMAIVVDEPAVPYDRLGASGLTAIPGIFYWNANNDYSGAYWLHPAVHFDARFSGLHFQGVRGDQFIDAGESDEWYQPNSIPAAIVVWGPASGSITAERITTQNVSRPLSLYMGHEDSTVVVGGSRRKGCKFQGTAVRNGVIYLESIGHATISHNRMDGGIFASDVSAYIHNNKIADGFAGLGGVVIAWSNDGRIENNSIRDLIFDYEWRSGISIFRSNNFVIADNELDDLVTGNGGIGIALRSGSSHNFVSGNELEDIGGDGIMVAGSESWVVENELEDIGGNGINLVASSADNFALDNELEDVAGIPILDQGSNNTVSDNEIEGDSDEDSDD